MEKRLFYKDPVTGIETPILTFEDDPVAIHNISTLKQDKIDPSINSESHHVVKTINELKFLADHVLHEPEIPGVYKQVLTLDASGNYKWADRQENLPVFPITTAQSPWTLGYVDFGSFNYEYMSFLLQTPSVTNATACAINQIPVTMSHAAINASVLVPDKLYLCTYDVSNPSITGGVSYDFVEIHNFTDIAHNLTTDLILHDTSNPEYFTYSKEVMNTFFDDVRASMDDTSTLLGTINKYDPWHVYQFNDYSRHDGSVYRCTAETANGIWDPSSWVETDMMNEIFELRGKHPVYTEVVTVKLSFENPHSGYSGDASVTISYPAESGKEPHTYEMNPSNNYTVQFFVEYDQTYYLDGAAVAGYITPAQAVNTAGKRKRTVELLYKPVGSGIFIIDDQGMETDYTLWNPVNNSHAKYVELTNFTLCPGNGKPDNSIVISKSWNMQVSTGKFCVEGKDFPSLSNITSAGTAALDYNGYINNTSIYQDCIALDASGMTFVDRYNEAHASEEGWVDIDISTYIPAVTYARDYTQVFLSKNIHGYIPSFGQMKLMFANLTELNAALTVLNCSTLTFTGQWQASTEYSAANMWCPNNKGDNTYVKTGNYNRFILMDMFANPQS